MKRAPTLLAAAALFILVGVLVSANEPSEGITVPTIAEFNALEDRVAELEARVDALEATPPSPSPSPSPSPNPSESPSPTQPPTGCTGVPVTAPASIQQAIDANPAGTTFCLSGAFTISAPIHPKDGDTFLGPAEVTGSTHSGFELKGAESGANILARDVTIRDLEIHGFSLRGIECWAGTVIEDNDIHDNGRNGLGCGLEDEGGVVVRGNLIHDNGSPEELGRGGGGMKFARANGVLVENNLIEANIGNGVWCDVDCGSFTVRDNTVLGSTRKGIFFEISRGPALIEGNTVQFNNCSPVYWPNPNPACALPSGDFGPQNAGSPGGGITANSSITVTIRGNVLGGNEVAGINFRDDGRPYDAPFDILVESNTLNGDALLKCGTLGIVCQNNT